MPKSSNENPGSPAALEAVIKQAIMDWSRLEGGPNPSPLTGAMVAGLALLVTYRLMHARLVTFERPGAAPDEPSTSLAPSTLVTGA